jgi:hypothetical protein
VDLPAQLANLTQQVFILLTIIDYRAHYGITLGVNLKFQLQENVSTKMELWFDTKQVLGILHGIFGQ